MRVKLIRQQAGFTILEAILALTIASMLVVVIAQFISANLTSNTREQTMTLIQNNTRQAVETVASSIRSAKSVEAVNSQPDSNSPGAPDNLYSWSSEAGSGTALILAVPAKDSNGNMIYIDGSHNSLYTDDVIYYLDPVSKILYRRLVANQSAPNNAAITTCPPAKATSTCPADAKVVEDIANLTTAYFDAKNNTVIAPSGTEAIKITLTQTKIIGTKTYSSSFTTIASLRNK